MNTENTQSESELLSQGRRRRSGHGRTTFLAESVFGRTTIFDYSAENVFAFSTFIEVRWPN